MSATEVPTLPPIPAEVLAAALAQDEPQRLALGHRLLNSVEAGPNALDFEWPDGWEEELERRSLAVEHGEATTSHEDLMARLRATLRVAPQVREDRSESTG